MTSVIFDFNGTLYQDTPIHLTAWQAFMRQFGIDITPDTFYKYMCGPPNSAILRRFLGDDLSDADIERYAEAKEVFYRQAVLDDPALQALTYGAEETLDVLTDRGVPIAIATGSIRSNCEFYMNTLHIDRWFDFDHIFYAERKLPGKPDPAIYRLAMQKLGYVPAETVVVEDTLAGIQSAISAGVGRVIAIDTTLGADAFQGIPQVERVIHDFIGFDRYV